ncbi:hypothetical protein ACFYWX_03990 [Streptomyces sp. NPDC002888]|uniref:hypothetical protein n=1 Tax=Streptomyces sp. NPDC002888 TaxID=3364668 RepID=UPI00367D58C0
MPDDPLQPPSAQLCVLKAGRGQPAPRPRGRATPSTQWSWCWSRPGRPAALFPSGRLRLEPGLSPADVARLLWQQLTDPRPADQERLFFEIYGHALRGRPEALPVLEGLVMDWLKPLVAAEVGAGAEPAAARNRARLGLATVRGLLLDLLATGDRAGVDSAMEEFLRLYYGSE